MENKILASMPEEESESMKDPKKKIRNLWENFKSGHQLFIERLVVYFKWLVTFTPVYLLIVLIQHFFSPSPSQQCQTQHIDSV